MSEAMRYVEDVLAGRRRECRWVRLACERHVRDLETGHERGLWFDERAARTVIAFFGLLRHSKGSGSGSRARWRRGSSSICGSCSGGGGCRVGGGAEALIWQWGARTGRHRWARAPDV